MQTTNNYGFRKPDKADFYDVADHNANMDAIDGLLKEQADAVETNTNAIRNVEASIVSPMEIRDMIENTPVTNAVYAESAGNAETVGNKHINDIMTRNSVRVDNIGFDNVNGLYLHIDGTLYQLPFGYGAQELSKYLSLTGGTLTGDTIALLYGYGLLQASTGAIHISSKAAVGDDMPYRGLSVSNATNGRTLEDALILTDFYNGTHYYYRVLHEGNSRKVIVSATEPADTSAVWIVPS